MPKFGRIGQQASRCTCTSVDSLAMGGASAVYCCKKLILGRLVDGSSRQTHPPPPFTSLVDSSKRPLAQTQPPNFTRLTSSHLDVNMMGLTKTICSKIVVGGRDSRHSAFPPSVAGKVGYAGRSATLGAMQFIFSVAEGVVVSLQTVRIADIRPLDGRCSTASRHTPESLVRGLPSRCLHGEICLPGHV